MTDSLTGKVAIVTGAGTGIGSATAMLLAQKGAKVLVTDFKDEVGQATADAIAASGGEAFYLHAAMPMCFIRVARARLLLQQELRRVIAPFQRQIARPFQTRGQRFRLFVVKSR
jgi:NAD(P)-dependent dehydrogenase (short-subunit alcohol dehydrogenase family)